MDEAEKMNFAERLFEEGKKFDWNQNKSAAAATLARANFQMAADMGHLRAACALAHMVYAGIGGGTDPEHGLLLLWSAFRRGDIHAFEELADLLASFGEDGKGTPLAEQASSLSAALDDAGRLLSKVDAFMDELVQRRARSVT